MRTDEFWTHLTQENNGCWTWSGYRLPTGYGVCQNEGKRIYAHRLAYWVATGVEPSKALLVCHKCDNPPCCNPDHLFLGTHADNAADRVAKGRTITPDRKGVNNGRAKLQPEHAALIRQRRAGGETLSKIAADYGVTTTAVWHVVQGRTWA